jgi:hypothetical protein
MKRRSARPFTVEIKNARTPRASHSAATARPLSGKSLQHEWAAFIAASKPVSAPKPEVSPHQPRPEAPARRVLPSLVPMFEPPNEPDPAVEAVQPKLPRVRRLRAKVERASAAPESNPVTKPNQPPSAAPPVLSRAVSNATAAPAVAILAETRSSHAERASRREAGLRPGERWKRRLPRILR